MLNMGACRIQLNMKPRSVALEHAVLLTPGPRYSALPASRAEPQVCQ